MPSDIMHSVAIDGQALHAAECSQLSSSLPLNKKMCCVLAAVEQTTYNYKTDLLYNTLYNTV